MTTYTRTPSGDVAVVFAERELTALVEWLDPNPVGEPTPGSAARAAKVFRELRSAANARPPTISDVIASTIENGERGDS